MRDSDSDAQYPFHQPSRHGRREPFDDETEDELQRGPQVEDARPPRPSRSRYRRRSPFHQREEPVTPQLPPNHVQKTLLIGAITGIVGELITIIVVLVNSPTFQSYNTARDQTIRNALAFTITGLTCLSLFIGLLLYLIAGFITGKVAIERRMGFLAGFVAAVVGGIFDYLVHQIPTYPDAHSTGFSGSVIGIGGNLLGGLIILLISGCIAGLVGYLGAWLATRRHHYYTGIEE